MYRESFKVLEEMKTMGYVPNVRHYINLLKISATGGDVQTALLLFDEIHRVPSINDQQDKLLTAYAYLLRAYANNQRIAIRSKEADKNIAAAVQLWERLIATGIQPKVEVLNEMLRVYSEGLRINRSKTLFENYKNYGLSPNFETYKIMIKMNCRSRRMDRALDIFQSMKTFELQIDFQTYVILIDGCTRSHLVTTGLRLLKEMKEKGFPIQPYHAYVVNFRRHLTKTPHIVNEIDRLAGRSEFVPYFLKPGFRKVQARRRDMSKSEEKALSKEPKLLTHTEQERDMNYPR